MPTTTYRAEPFLEAARRLGVDVAIGSDRCHVIAEMCPGAARGAIPLDFRDPEAAAATIVEAAGERPFAAVIPTDDRTTEIAARASERLGLRANPVEAARAARDKRRLREALARAGLPHPRFRVFPLDADPGAAARAVAAYPAVLKPLHLAASRGVIRADDEPSFVAAFERIGRLLRSPDIAVLKDPAASLILAEDFIPGVEVALEALLDPRGGLRPLALFDKPDPLDGPFFEETIYVTPSRLPDATQRAVVEAAAAAARAIGLRDGPVHAEVRIGPGGVFVIDLAARAIGGLCSRTLRFGTGVTLEELLIRHALGLPDGLERERRPAGVMMLPIPRGGLLRGVSGIEEASAVPGVAEVTVTQKLQTVVRPLPEGNQYLGFVFARADTPEAVEAALRAAQARLRFDISPVLESIDVRSEKATPCASPDTSC